MAHLTGSLNETLNQVLIEQNVALLGEEPCPIPVGDAASIVSGLPCIRIDSGRETFRGRRKRLRLKRGARQTTFLARTRPMPPEPAAGWLVVGWARDRRNRYVPVCAVDASEGRIHVLLELDTATVVEASVGLDPAGLLAEAFIGEPIAFLLRHAPPPHVGADVKRYVRSLLENRPLNDHDAIENELKLLHRFAPRGALPRALAHRLEKLTRALRHRPDEVTENRIAQELTRLRKLVESRALGALRLGPTRIEGLINPGAFGAEWRLRPVMFRLQLGASPFHPILQTWNPLRPAPRRGYGHCLGEAQPMLHEQDADGDLYGLIDTVINFRETNRIRAAPVVEPSWLGGKLSDWLAPMF